MKLIVTVLLLISSTVAQDHAATTAAESACGPTPVTFSVTPDTTQHPTPQPDPDKALVFVVEDLGQCKECEGGSVGAPLVRVGVDGTWAGAIRGNSYFFFDAAPGEHHLCMNWQSRLSSRADVFAMANLTAEAGKVYYLRVRVFPGEANFSFDLDLVNSDQGKYLVASSPYSVSRPKK